MVTTGSSTHGAEIQERFVTAISDGGLVGYFVVELFTENDVGKRNVDTYHSFLPRFFSLVPSLRPSQRKTC